MGDVSLRYQKGWLHLPLACTIVHRATWGPPEQCCSGELSVVVGKSVILRH